MVLLILGLLLVLAAFVLGRVTGTAPGLRKLLAIGGVALGGIGIATSTVRQIDPGEVGVQVLFGSVQSGILHEGLSFVNPLIDVETFSTRTQNYTMSAVVDEGQKNGDDAIRVLSSDGLEVMIDLTVLYRIIPGDAPRMLQETGTDFLNTFVRPITRTRIRENAVYFAAVDLYSKKREEFQTRISQAIEQDFHKRGLLLENVLVRNITLPTSVKESIERKITAEQEAQRMEFVLAKGKQEADLKRIEAQGVADAQKILNEGLSDKILQYESIKMQRELASSPNSKVIIMGSGRNSPPLFFDSK